MTSLIRSDQRGRVGARTILALFVIFALVVIFVPTKPLGDRDVLAQSSPTGTGARIQFLNPSGATANNDEGTSGPGREVSTKQDADQSYHLVAWVANAPSNAIVEFKWSAVDDDTNENTIGTGTKHGNDTYDIFWNSVPTTDGAYEVTAILFSGPGGAKLAEDKEEVVVNNQDDPRSNPAMIPQSEDRGETVEITYPAQAGPWGAFRQHGPSGGRFIGVVDVNASDNEGAANMVRAYYTTTAPGNEPSWVRCSADDGEGFVAGNPATGAAADGVRCTLAEGVSPTVVTAIAAASGDADQSPDAGDCAPSGPAVPTCGEGEDSGDAHRAFGYVQVPNTMTVSPSTQTQTDRDPAAAGNQFECSSVISGVLTDQFGRKVAGANADVHAAGPADDLRFDDPDTTGSHQAPNSGNHLTEPSADCEDDTRPPDLRTTEGQGQGDHEVAGEGDMKHIETAAAGTNDAGAIAFRLVNRSTTITGTTQISVFHDRDDDDLQCSSEPRGAASIGWGSDPAAPSGLPDQTTNCPEPQPTGTATSSPTSTATPTRTATGTGSPSPSPGTSRTVTLSAERGRVTVGDDITLTGQIFSSDESCEDNEFVRIRRRVHGTNAFEDFLSAQSDATGAFSLTFPGRRSADYQAVATEHDQCAEASSSSITVLVRVSVSVTTDKVRPERGDRLRFLGRVVPKHSGTRVVLQRRKGGRWVRVERDTLNRKSRYRIVIDANWRRNRVFRVKWNSQDDDHATGFSRRMRIRTRR